MLAVVNHLDHDHGYLHRLGQRHHPTRPRCTASVQYSRSWVPPAPKSGCLGGTRSEGPHSLDEGVDLRIGPDGDAAPVLVRWKTPRYNDIPMPHELGELLDRHARVEEYEIAMRLGIRKV